MHPLVKLAKAAVEAYVTKGETISSPSELIPEMRENAGVFVSIKKHGELRGCIGTFMPTCGNVAEEIIRNAICAATQDPRFERISKDEMDDLVFSVDVLTPPQEVKNLKELDPEKYGIIVSKGMRKGLLLPDLEGVETVEEQIRISRLKAGIMDNEDVKIFKFEVRRYH